MNPNQAGRAITATDDPRRWHRGSPRQWHREATERLYAVMMREMGERETELTQAFVAENVARLHGATPAEMLSIDAKFPDGSFARDSQRGFVPNTAKNIRRNSRCSTAPL
jgi:hypothetical protein